MNQSPKQVAKVDPKYMRWAREIMSSPNPLLSEVIATAISKAVEEETSRCAKVAESWMAVSHEMGRDIAKAIRSKKEVSG